MRRQDVKWKLTSSPGLIGLIALVLSACDPSALKTRTPASQPRSAPQIEGVDHRGERFSLSAAAEEGPVVVIFYRGHW